MKFEIKNEVTLRDLKTLGLQGGATALLDDGSELILKHQYAIKKDFGIINGERLEVNIIYPYRKIYNNIRVIKRDRQIIAEKVRRQGSSHLLLTGYGYQRRSKTKK
ncbi:hypothetical protein MK559_05205 [Streptococcus gallolyticus subsp. gallolyticus]|uniref:hypothetical protein n=1 Tax=Streptococcus gallolyticus TaxID=315405 RepID=UPI0022850063|nr:hypothetical protein [Streptococcus gallolyticus]MCY7178386.1 hypothetical protein [Streptococcus gallolyticus subsp. gallolyticus]